MQNPLLPYGRLGVTLIALLAVIWLANGCKEEDGCEADKSRVESCDRRFTADVCSDADGRCTTACFAKASCAELDEIDRREQLPAWLSQCLAPCQNTFTCKNGEVINDFWRCDVSEDCSDGSDEKGCRYYECNDGQRVRSSAPCDGFSQCDDESDEGGC